jgi:hypothetical protein
MLNDCKYYKFYSVSIFIILFTTFKTYSQSIQNDYIHPIKNSTGMAAINEFEYLQNPAQLRLLDSTVLALNYSPSQFGLPEISPAAFMFAFNLHKNLSLGFSFDGLGNNLYKEYSGSLHCSYQIAESYFIGCTMEYSIIYIKNYSQADMLQFNLGTLIKLTENLYAGICFKNVTRASYTGGAYTPDQNAVVGLGIKLFKDLSFETNLNMAYNQSSGVSGSLKYIIADIISLRISMLSNPTTFDAGIRIHALPYLSLNGELFHREILGYSQNYGLSIFW